MGVRRLPLLLAPLVLAIVLGPILVTDRGFDSDFTNHLWLISAQGDAIARHGHPTLFFQTSFPGVFYPHFLFYGGTLYALFGGLSAALGGQPLIAYVAAYVIGATAAYGGWTWLGRQAGLGSLAAQVPATLFVTSAYYLTNAYGRGAWPEFMATSALPVVVAAATWLLRAERWRVGPAVAFTVAMVVLTGSHNATLVWGTVFLIALAMGGLVALGPQARAAARRRGPWLLGLSVLAVAVNAWFLGGDIGLQTHTVIGNAQPYDNGAPYFNTLAAVLDPLRHVPHASTSRALYVQAPVLALVWAVVALVVLRRGAAAWTRRLGMALGLGTAGFLLLTLRDDPTVGRLPAGIWSLLPTPMRHVQFAYRLQTYTALCVCGLVLLGLVALREHGSARVSRRLAAGLGAVLALSAGLAVWQVWSSPSREPDRRIVLAGPNRLPPTWFDPGVYLDPTAPLVRTEPARSLRLDPRLLARGGTMHVDAPVGPAPFSTNIAAGRDVIALDGLQVVGRSPRNLLVVRREPGAATTGPVALRLHAREDGVIGAGRAISLGALALLLVLLVVVPVRARRRSRAA